MTLYVKRQEKVPESWQTPCFRVVCRHNFVRQQILAGNAGARVTAGSTSGRGSLPGGSILCPGPENREADSWKVPLGVVDELEAKGIPKTGVFNLGGSIPTAGGLVFIADTNDHRCRATDRIDI